MNLAELLELSETTVQVYVLDSHRPFNLRNVYHRQVRISSICYSLCMLHVDLMHHIYQVWLIDDGATEAESLPRLDDIMEEEEDEMSEDDEVSLMID